MRYGALCCTLLLGGIALAQQGQTPSASHPPYQTPPTFPEGRQTPRQTMPPDTQAPPPQAMSSEKVEGAISDQLRAEPALSGTNIDAKVDDNSVVLTGDVDSMRQHDTAIRIAQSNAGNRRVVDKIQLKHRT